MKSEVKFIASGFSYEIPLPPSKNEAPRPDRSVSYPLDGTFVENADSWLRFPIAPIPNDNGKRWAPSQMVVKAMLCVEGYRLHTYFESSAEAASRISRYDHISELAARSVDLGELHRLLCANDGGSPQTCIFFNEFAHWFPFYRITDGEICFCFAKLGPTIVSGAGRQTHIVLHPWRLDEDVRRPTGAAAALVYEKSQLRRA